MIAKLVSHIHSQHLEESFQRIVEKAIQQLEGAFACAFKSRVFPGELVATRRGSPLLVGIKAPQGIEADHIPVQYRSESCRDANLLSCTRNSCGKQPTPGVSRRSTTTK